MSYRRGGGSGHRNFWRNRRGGGRVNRHQGGIDLADLYDNDPRSSDYLDNSPESSGCFGIGRRQKYTVNNRGNGQSPVRGRRRYDLNRSSAQVGTVSRSAGTSVARDLANWHEVVIKRGKDLGREFILQSLDDYCDKPVHPILFTIRDNGDATFLLDSKVIADTVRSANRRISTSAGQQMVILVSSTPCPFIPVDKAHQELLKQSLHQRYDADTAKLNLSVFHSDPALLEQALGGLLSILRNNVMYAIAKVIGENCTTLHTIDFSGNRIRNLDYFATLTSRCPNVNVLILNMNNIDRVSELEKLAGWKTSLTELHLDRNPICNQFSEPSVYISTTRKIFPKLKVLDGENLPAPIGFDLDEIPVKRSVLPPFKASFFVNETIKTLVHKFVEQYYTIFDSDEGRQSLLDAYAPDATLTLTCWVLEPSGENNHRSTMNYEGLSRNSHNILRMENWERYRAKLVQKGRLAVVSYLEKFPKTTHDPASFVIDVSFCHSSVICFNITGLYKDKTDTESDPVKCFNRVFLVTPSKAGGDGISILNEQIFLTVFSRAQVKNYLSMVQKAIAAEATQAQAAANSMAAVSAPQLPGPSTNGMMPQLAPLAAPMAAALMAPLPGVPDQVHLHQPPTVEMLVAKFMEFSGMKRPWAEKCLAENDGDYSKAAQVFVELRKAGSIPAEAFQ